MDVLSHVGTLLLLALSLDVLHHIWVDLITGLKRAEIRKALEEARGFLRLATNHMEDKRILHAVAVQ